jgi:prevent-host-death family protein
MFLHPGDDAMPITTLTSREFNQDTGYAKQAARKGPVIITDRGRPAHVLITIEEYQRLTGQSPNIVEMLGMPGVEDVDFEPPRLPGQIHRRVDLT